MLGKARRRVIASRFAGAGLGLCSSCGGASAQRPNMTLPIAAFVASVAVVVPFFTGCAEEEAEGREAAYPVGATAPPAEPPPMAGAPGEREEAPPASAPGASGSETGSEEVVVGADDEAPQ